MPTSLQEKKMSAAAKGAHKKASMRTSHCANVRQKTSVHSGFTQSYLRSRTSDNDAHRLILLPTKNGSIISHQIVGGKHGESWTTSQSDEKSTETCELSTHPAKSHRMLINARDLFHTHTFIDVDEMHLERPGLDMPIMYCMHATSEV